MYPSNRRVVLNFIAAALVATFILVPGIAFAQSSNAINDTVFAVIQNTGGVETAWKVVLSLVDFLVVIGLLVAAFANILHLKLDNYAIKKMLPGLIIGIILANLSFFIMRLLIEVATVSTDFIGTVIQGYITLPTGVSAGNMTGSQFIQFATSQLILDSLSTGLVNAFKNASVAFHGATAAALVIGAPYLPAASGLTLLALLLFPLVIILFFWIIGFLLYIRSYVLVVLFILSPAAFFAAGVPPFKSYFQKFWGMLSKWLMMAPIVFLVLGLTDVWLSKVAIVPSTGKIVVRNWGDFFLFNGVALAFLYYAIRLPFILSSSAPIFGMDVMKKWGDFGKNSARNTARYGGDAVRLGGKSINRLTRGTAQKAFMKYDPTDKKWKYKDTGIVGAVGKSKGWVDKKIGKYPAMRAVGGAIRNPYYSVQGAKMAIDANKSTFEKREKKMAGTSATYQLIANNEARFRQAKDLNAEVWRDLPSLEEAHKKITEELDKNGFDYRDAAGRLEQTKLENIRKLVREGSPGTIANRVGSEELKATLADKSKLSGITPETLAELNLGMASWQQWSKRRLTPGAVFREPYAAGSENGDNTTPQNQTYRAPDSNSEQDRGSSPATQNDTENPARRVAATNVPADSQDQDSEAVTTAVENEAEKNAAGGGGQAEAANNQSGGRGATGQTPHMPREESAAIDLGSATSRVGAVMASRGLRASHISSLLKYVDDVIARGGHRLTPEGLEQALRAGGGGVGDIDTVINGLSGPLEQYAQAKRAMTSALSHAGGLSSLGSAAVYAEAMVGRSGPEALATAARAPELGRELDGYIATLRNTEKAVGQQELDKMRQRLTQLTPQLSLPSSGNPTDDRQKTLETLEHVRGATSILSSPLVQQQLRESSGQNATDIIRQATTVRQFTDNAVQQTAAAVDQAGASGTPDLSRVSASLQAAVANHPSIRASMAMLSAAQQQSAIDTVATSLKDQVAAATARARQNDPAATASETISNQGQMDSFSHMVDEMVTSTLGSIKPQPVAPTSQSAATTAPSQPTPPPANQPAAQAGPTPEIPTEQAPRGLGDIAAPPPEKPDAGA